MTDKDRLKELKFVIAECRTSEVDTYELKIENTYEKVTIAKYILDAYCELCNDFVGNIIARIESGEITGETVKNVLGEDGSVDDFSFKELNNALDAGLVDNHLKDIILTLSILRGVTPNSMAYLLFVKPGMIKLAMSIAIIYTDEEPASFDISPGIAYGLLKECMLKHVDKSYPSGRGELYQTEEWVDSLMQDYRTNNLSNQREESIK